MGASCVRWTVDTERAFLLALRQTGQVIRAAAAIGRSPGVCYQRRDRNPAFAAAWAQTLADMEAERLADAQGASGAPNEGEPGAPVRPLTRARRDGWTQQRRRQFCRALADTGSYGEAAARVGLSLTSVRNLRRRSPDFQAQCDKALLEGGTTVEEAAYVRAVEGWEEEVYHEGKLVGYRRRFSDTLARSLLEHKAEAGAPAPKLGRGWSPAPTQAEIDAALIKRLDGLAETLRRKERERLATWADDMRARGLAP